MQGLSEICGEAGAGKTQLCLQLLLTVQKPVVDGGLDSGAIYLCCEGLFPAPRLSEMASNCGSNQHDSENASTCRDLPSSLTRVLVEQIEDAEHLWDVLTVTVPLELRRGRVKLVIIDSIAAVCRGEFSNSVTGLTDRADVLISLAAYMKRLSERYGCAFVLVNQVSAVFHTGTKSATSMAESFAPNGQEPSPSTSTVVQNSSSLARPSVSSVLESINNVSSIPLPKVCPALGITWTSCINTRILLTRGDQGENVDGCLRRRQMRVLLSSCVPCGVRCHYTVTGYGVKMVDDEIAALQSSGLLNRKTFLTSPEVHPRQESL